MFERLTNTKLRFLLYYFILISILELTAHLYGGIFSTLAARLWIATAVFCFSAILVRFAKATLSELRAKNYVSTAAVAVLILFLAAVMGNPGLSDLSPDAAQQAAAGLDSLNSADLNYTGKAFLGYPARQYLIAAAPAALFGRSVLTLHLGFGVPFLFGILILYCGLRKWLELKGLNTALAALPLYALFVFPYVPEYYSNFEQALYPISFTMIAVGFFLLLIAEPDLTGLIGISWVGGVLANSYTPALASMGLLFVFLIFSAYLWVRRPGRMPFAIPSPGKAANASLLAAGTIAVFFFSTLLATREDRITHFYAAPDHWERTGRSILDFLVDANASFLGMFGIIAVTYLLFALMLQLKPRDFLMASWVLAVVAASNLLQGYTTYQPAWILQRATIVIPVLVVGVALTVYDALCNQANKVQSSAVVILVVIFSGIGLHNFYQPNQSFQYFNHVQPIKYLWIDLAGILQDHGLDETAEFNLVIYSNNALIKNPADYGKFLAPNAHTYTPAMGAVPEHINLRFPTFVYTQEGNPSGSLVADPVFLTFFNRKHHQKINWYREFRPGE